MRTTQPNDSTVTRGAGQHGTGGGSPAPPSVAPPSVGATARRSREVREADIGLFGDLTGDRNPLHVDHHIAAASRFGGIIVQGGVVTGLLNAVVAEDLPGPGSVFLRTEWDHRAPARPGDVLTAEVEVLAARTDKPVSTLRTTVTNDHGEVVVDGSAVVWRDPVVAAAVPEGATDTTAGIR